jgi:hypothetical protein
MKMQKVVRAVWEDFEFDGVTRTYLQYEDVWYCAPGDVAVSIDGELFFGETKYVKEEALLAALATIAMQEKEFKRLRRIERRGQARWLRENPLLAEKSEENESKSK